MNNIETIRIKELNLDLLQPNIETMNNPDQGSQKILTIGKPGCFQAGTEVLLYNGEIKKVEDIIPGENVMGWDSTPRTVLELCRNRDEMFKIQPIKGDSVVVNKNHILTLKCTGYNNSKKGEIIDITVADFLNKSKTFQERYKWFRTGVSFPEKSVDIDPYCLGIWLGDGTSATSEITNIDPEVIEYINKYFETLGCVVTKKGSEPSITYRISSHEGTKGKNIFLNFLRKYDLLNNKHIPLDYKANSRENRLLLLAGILDTDGYYDNSSNVFEISQKNQILLDDIVYIARSLGFSAYKKEVNKICTNTGVEGTYYRCFISGEGIETIPTKISRKRAITRTQIKDSLVTGFTLTSVGIDNYYGFTLDGDRRFLLSDFSVVHNTGKSTLIGSLLYAKKHIFPCGVAFSGTEDSNHFYKTIFPSTFVFNTYDEAQIEKVIRRQKIAKEHLENPWAVMILDDCTDDPALFRKPLQQGLYKRGRHWKLWYILSLQYGMDIRPVIRTNIDGVFILREPNLRNRKTMYENYAGIIPDFKLFCDILDQITDDYTALYIHNATRTNDWKDCVFWYKAKPAPKDFKFGCDTFWDHHFQRYNEEYVEPITV